MRPDNPAQGSWGEPSARSNGNRLGQVYTPRLLAEWVGELMLAHAAPKRRRLLVVDPACGDGELLEAVRIKTTVPVDLVGCDISRSAASAAGRRLGRGAKVFQADALVAQWEKRLGHRLADAVIANPPWGARTGHSAGKLRRIGYEVAYGQFDSYDLFIELCLRLVRPGGVVALIVPDSLLLPEHELSRRLLLRHSLRVIARLGEGFFPNVFRAVSIVICTRDEPTARHKVRCLRLTPTWRNRVLAGEETLAAADKALGHVAPQSRFAQDANAHWDIDATVADHKVMALLGRHVNGWTNWVHSGRGVELSKHGLVIRCKSCGSVRPLPRNEGSELLCSNCNRRLPDPARAVEAIVEPLRDNVPGFKPFIVGEDVHRYRVQPSRMIQSDLDGINYKTAGTFEGERLLVRKTGLGLKAALDSSGALTNQVVFHYRLRPEAPEFFLHYLLGLLCSRSMLAYHLKRAGENEWRSHPYVTQKVLATLPVPTPMPETREWRLAQAIADAARVFSASGSVEDDVRLEGLVASLFRMRQADCNWAMNVIEQAEQLEPIRSLRLPAGIRISPREAY